MEWSQLRSSFLSCYVGAQARCTQNAYACEQAVPHQGKGRVDHDKRQNACPLGVLELV